MTRVKWVNYTIKAIKSEALAALIVNFKTHVFVLVFRIVEPIVRTDNETKKKLSYFFFSLLIKKK